MAIENRRKAAIDTIKANIFAVVTMVVTAIVLLGSTTSFASCTENNDSTGQHEQATFIPQAPDYNSATMWVTADGDTDGTGADIFYVVSTWETPS